MKKSSVLTTLLISILSVGCSNTNNPYPQDAIVKTFHTTLEEFFGTENLEEIELENGVYDITKNEDGSFNYIVSKEYLEKSKSLYYTEVESYIEEYIETGIFPSLLYVQINENMTEFNVYLSSDEITFYEIMLFEELMLYGINYAEYFGETTEIPNINVQVFDANNTLIKNYNSSNFYEDLINILNDENMYIEEDHTNHNH